METEYEKAQTALDMFCRAAKKATGDYREIQRLENGDLAVVQTFKSAKEAIYNPNFRRSKEAYDHGRAVLHVVRGPCGSGEEPGTDILARVF